MKCFFGNCLKKVSAPSKTSEKKDIIKSKFFLSKPTRTWTLNLKNVAIVRRYRRSLVRLSCFQRSPINQNLKMPLCLYTWHRGTEIILTLSSYFKSVAALGTHDGMLSLGFRQTKDCVTLLTLSVNVCFSIATLIFHKPEKAWELFIFTSSPCDISRHRSEYDHSDKSPWNEEIEQKYIRIFFDEKKNYHREEQAHYVYHENARFQEILRGNKK